MRVCVIDGHGGGLGKRLVRELRTGLSPGHELIGLGMTQAAATAMGEAGAARICVGPKAIAETVRTADLIVAPLNVLFPDRNQWEVTSTMVQTILEARCRKILLPVNRFRVEVAGTESHKLEQLIATSLLRVRSLLSGVPES